jgi:hypothetical protein
MMPPKRKRIILVILLIISLVNYSRIPGTENIRAIEFLSIFTIGMLSGLILREIAVAVRNRWFV